MKFCKKINNKILYYNNVNIPNDADFRSEYLCKVDDKDENIKGCYCYIDTFFYFGNC